MSPLELLAPEAAEKAPFSVRLARRRLTSRDVAAERVPFSVRLAQRRLTSRDAAAREAAARADRRAYERRNASDLEWLRAVRLTGGTGYSVKLIDLSEGGALVEVDAPLRPGIILTLEMTGPGLDAAVPLEVLRCYIASLHGKAATYRGACAFAHKIELPGGMAPAPAAADFAGTDAALTDLLERCTSAKTRGASSRSAAGITIERTEVLHVLDALQARTALRASDPLSRHTSDLLSAILPALRDGAPREVAVAALEDRLRGLPHQWRSLLQPTGGRLASLIDHCGAAAIDPIDTAAAQPDVAALGPAVPIESAFQRIVVRYSDGKIVKGYTQDFHPSRPQFSLWPSINATPKERVVVPVRRLKAVFFVRDFGGNANYRDRKVFGDRAQGRRVELTFADGEIVLGTTLNYRPDGQGFFVSPADPDSNNTRIFVVATALQRVRFL